jgi:hypothetical protein
MLSCSHRVVPADALRGLVASPYAFSSTTDDQPKDPLWLADKC